GGRDSTRVQCRPSLSHPGREPDVPLREQFLLEGRLAGASNEAARRVAESRPPRGEPHRRAVRGQQLRHSPGRLHREHDGRPLGLRGHRTRQRAEFRQLRYEIDIRSPATPAGTILLASIPDLMGPGRTAAMTYY